MGKGSKFEKSYQFTPGEAAAYLRRLADQLDQGRMDMDQAEIDLDGEVKVKESVKDKTGKRSVKIKVKLAGSGPQVEEEAAPGREEALEPESPSEGAAQTGPEEDAAAQAPPAAQKKPPAYKRLKKMMGDDYKALKAALREGGQPEQALVDRFVDQCRLMVTYPDKGDPYYPDFGRATDALARAAAQKDQAAMEEALAEMGRLRKNCHRRLK